MSGRAPSVTAECLVERRSLLASSSDNDEAEVYQKFVQRKEEPLKGSLTLSPQDVDEAKRDVVIGDEKIPVGSLLQITEMRSNRPHYTV